MRSAIICLLIGLTAPFIYADNWDNFKLHEANMNKLLNAQITVELQGHYTYLQMSHKFNERTSYYPKVAAYFRAKADEEMQHAERFIQYQNQRGGTFKSESITGASTAGVTDCAPATVDSLYTAFKCAQSLEIFVTDKLTELAKEAMNVKPITVAETTYIDNNNPLLKGQSVIITVAGGTKKSLRSYLIQADTAIDSVEYIELAEMITHEFLGHQIEDTKEIANYLYTLEKFRDAASSNAVNPAASSNAANTAASSNVENLASYLFDKNL